MRTLFTPIFAPRVLIEDECLSIAFIFADHAGIFNAEISRFLDDANKTLFSHADMMVAMVRLPHRRGFRDMPGYDEAIDEPPPPSHSVILSLSK